MIVDSFASVNEMSPTGWNPPNESLQMNPQSFANGKYEGQQMTTK